MSDIDYNRDWDYVRTHQGMYESSHDTIVIVGNMGFDEYTTMVQYSQLLCVFSEVNIDGNGWQQQMFKQLKTFTFSVRI